jgi:hypothetical protein
MRVQEAGECKQAHTRCLQAQHSAAAVAHKGWLPQLLLHHHDTQTDARTLGKADRSQVIDASSLWDALVLDSVAAAALQGGGVGQVRSGGGGCE